MVNVETITEKVRMLPVSSQMEVFELVEGLLKQSANLSAAEKAAAWKAWADGHRDNRAVVEDSRDAIYENVDFKVRIEHLS